MKDESEITIFEIVLLENTGSPILRRFIDKSSSISEGKKQLSIMWYVLGKK